MSLFDLVRFGVFAMFGAGVGLMAMTNVLAFRLLPPARLLRRSTDKLKFGFLWWHITTISLSFLCIGVVAVDRTVGRLGQPPGWQSLVTLIGMTLFAVAQLLIFYVERQRLVLSRATAQVEAGGNPLCRGTN